MFWEARKQESRQAENEESKVEEKQETAHTEAGNKAACAQWLEHMEAGREAETS